MYIWCSKINDLSEKLFKNMKIKIWEFFLYVLQYVSSRECVFSCMRRFHTIPWKTHKRCFTIVPFKYSMKNWRAVNVTERLSALIQWTHRRARRMNSSLRHVFIKNLTVDKIGRILNRRFELFSDVPNHVPNHRTVLHSISSIKYLSCLLSNKGT